MWADARQGPGAWGRVRWVPPGVTACYRRPWVQIKPLPVRPPDQAPGSGPLDHAPPPPWSRPPHIRPRIRPLNQAGEGGQTRGLGLTFRPDRAAVSGTPGPSLLTGGGSCGAAGSWLSAHGPVHAALAVSCTSGDAMRLLVGHHRQDPSACPGAGPVVLAVSWAAASNAETLDLGK